VQPTNQETFIDPYNARLFDMGIEDSRVYLSRQANQVYKAFGEDIIVQGMFISYLIEGSKITFTVSTGRCIIDTTLCIFKDPIILDIDVTPYADNGFLVVSIGYRYIQTMFNNRPYLKVSWVSLDGDNTLPEDWSPQRDRMIICWYEFTKDSSNNITITQPHCNRNDGILIGGKIYYPARGVDPEAGLIDRILHDLSCFINLNGGTYYDDELMYCVVSGGTYLGD
jgi:hypothetical protein